MSSGIIRYTEPLESDELLFLVNKAEKDRANYFKVFRILMIISFITPFAGAWYRAFDGADNAFSPLRYFSVAAVLIGLSSASVYISYRIYLRKIQLDIRDKTKTIEKNKIVKKVHIQARGTFHFYIDSAIKLSIEVSESDFQLLNIGDEVSIEFSTHATEYLGYF
jgi:hypothetical protein